MPEDTQPFAAVVEELQRLNNAALMLAWHEVRETLDRGGLSPTKGHRLRLRHYAFRKVAVERFGAEGHIEHYRATFGG